MRARLALALSLLTGLSVGLASCGGPTSGAAPSTLRFTAIPDANTTELAEKFAPVADYLSDQLGVDVEYVPTTSYGASVELFKNGDVQLAWFGGLTGVQARAAVDGAHAIAQGVVDPNYKTYFIAHEDSGVAEGEGFWDSLAGKTFRFGSESSTSGRLMPEHFIRSNTGKSPQEFFGRENSYSGAHDQTALDVQAGTFDAGALSYKKYDSMVEKGDLDPEVCRIVWTTPGYPDYNWTAHPMLEDFRDGFTDEVKRALVDMKDPNLLEAVLRKEGLIEATDADFQVIHDLASELGFLDD